MTTPSMSHFFIMVTFVAKLNSNFYNQKIFILLLLLGIKQMSLQQSDWGHCKRFAVDPDKQNVKADINSEADMEKYLFKKLMLCKWYFY